NYTEIAAGRGSPHGGVWLDISHRPAEVIHARLPRMVEQFAAVGVDITREPMEVAPTAHYWLGGNSLAEILVFGRIAAEQAGVFAVREPAPPLDEALAARHRGELARLGA